MYIRTDSQEDSNKFMVWVNSALAIRQIRKILRNKKSHSSQIKAIEKVLKDKVE